MTGIAKYLSLSPSLSLSLSYVRVCTRTSVPSLSRTVSIDVRARGCQESQEETNEKRASEQPKQLCTSRLGSGLHLYPRVCHSRRAQGADAPIRAYNLPLRSLSLARSLARSLDRARILLQPSTRGLDPRSLLNRPRARSTRGARLMNPSALLARVREITLARMYVREQPLGLTMATALPVVDLPANAITPTGHFISERCLGHDSKALIRRFPPVFRRRWWLSARGGNETRRWHRYWRFAEREIVVKLLRRKLRVRAARGNLPFVYGRVCFGGPNSANWHSAVRAGVTFGCLMNLGNFHFTASYFDGLITSGLFVTISSC